MDSPPALHSPPPFPSHYPRTDHPYDGPSSTLHPNPLHPHPTSLAQVIRMTVKVKIKLSLGQLDVSVGGKQWLGKLLSGFKLAEAQVAQLRLDRVAIEMRVRIFWYAKMEQMKIMVLKYPSPKLVDLTHELTLCSKLKVPPHLIKGAIEKLVLPFVTGRYFHVDLKPPPKKKGGRPGEVEVPEDAELPWHTEDPKCTDATGAGAEVQPVAA